MKNSAAGYHAVSSLENQVYHSDAHEAGVSGDEFYSTSERLSGAVQTKWTYFLLGCAILLPWSGDPFRQTTHSIYADEPPQRWLMGRRSSCPDSLAPNSIRPSVPTALPSIHSRNLFLRFTIHSL